MCVCKQKTAYEMRISDWSSDVCSSDLFSKRSLPVREAVPGIKHGGVDMAAIGENLVQRGAGQHSPQRARVAGAFGFVIAVEQIGISGIERPVTRSEEHTSELQSLMRISYAVFCLKKKNKDTTNKNRNG